MNQNQCSREEFLCAIHGILERKELTYAEISHRLSVAVEHERLRPQEEIRETFIQACLDLQYIFDTPEAPAGGKESRIRKGDVQTTRRHAQK